MMTLRPPPLLPRGTHVHPGDYGEDQYEDDYPSDNEDDDGVDDGDLEHGHYETTDGMHMAATC